jgi:aconitate hydratase
MTPHGELPMAQDDKSTKKSHAFSNTLKTLKTGSG